MLTRARNTRLRSVLIKSGVLLAVLCVAFLASGVILAQSSQDYDLGCRADLTAGGYSAAYPNVGILHSSVGQWNAGRTTIQGSGIILQSGYILTASQATVAGAGAEETLAKNAESTTYLPAIYAVQFIRYVRPCNWGWAAAAQAPQ